MGPLNLPATIVFGSLILAFVLLVISYLWLVLDKKNFPSLNVANYLGLLGCMGKPQWDFSNSWATSLTTVGALLGTLLSVGPAHEEKNIGLSVFFGMLVIIAPFLYNAITRHVKTDTGDGQGTPEYQGYIGIFLLTSLLTLWAVCGELVTVIVVLYDLTDQGFLSLSIRPLFLVVLIAALLCICIYAIHTIPWTVQDQLEDQAAKQAEIHARRTASLTEAERASGKEITPQEELNPSMKSWSLL